MTAQDFRESEAYKLESYRGIITFATTALSATFYANGAALIAGLALLGAENGPEPRVLIPALVTWAFGVFLSAAASVAAYTAQHQYTFNLSGGVAAQLVGLACAGLSVFTFLIGSMVAAYRM